VTVSKPEKQQFAEAISIANVPTLLMKTMTLAVWLKKFSSKFAMPRCAPFSRGAQDALWKYQNLRPPCWYEC
jgi:hypothetical protein